MIKPAARSWWSFRFVSLACLAGALGAPGLVPPTSAQVIAPAPKVNAPAPVAPPLALTASDGTGLELVSLSAQAVLEDPLAFTELRLAFRNPQDRVREGRFRITLPAGATISRFAMRIGDAWQEGEIVEQQAARVAYEDFLHRRQDPALLEAEAGNEFSARVFPIPPNGVKELVVAYAQELPHAGAPYRLPLRGLPRVGDLQVRALVSRGAPAARATNGPPSSLGGARLAHEAVEVHKRDFVPDRDFEVLPGAGAPRGGLRHENLVVARVVPLAAAQARDEVGSLHVLFDTSASRALGLREQVSAFEALVAELRASGDPLLVVTAFDQDVAPLYVGRASAMGDSVRKKVLERRALGASDLERGLATVAGGQGAGKITRVLLVTDGVATAGDTAVAALRARVKALGARGVERMDVLAVGGIRDDAALGRLVTAGLARDGVVLDAAQPPAALARRLTQGTRSGLRVAVEGASWVWPAVLDGVQPGDPVLVYADLPRDLPVRLTVDGASVPLAGPLAPVERPLLERAWVHARIRRLLQQRDSAAVSDRDLVEALRRQIVELSVRHRVLSPFTSLLVLETEADYARFGIERRALADIMTVGPTGVALVHRTDVVAEPALPAVVRRDQGRRPQVADERLLGARDGEERSAPAKHADLDDFVGGARRAARAGGAEPRASAVAAPVVVAAEPAERPARVAAKAGLGSALRREPSASVEALASPAPPPASSSDRARPLPESTAAPALTRRAQPRDDARARERLDSLASEGAWTDRGPAALQGESQEILALVQRGRAREALGKALAWRQRDAADVLALVALGECWEALGNMTEAARAYGSLIDLFPGRADLRRFAGERLERVRGAAALALAVDTYRKAVEQRPDHPASHRLLAFALLKQGRPRQAFEALATGLAQRYPDGRFAGVGRILSEDLGLAAAVWTRHEPGRAAEIRGRLQRAGGTVESEPSLRFVLNWETDANDVDFHVRDARGGHAYYSNRHLPSGGDLYADVTTGYGPECFTIRGRAAAGPYRVQAHYYSRGPMGYGMGKLQVVEHDGQGNLRFEERPFVIMQDGAFVDLGQVSGSTLSSPAIVVR